MKAFLKLSVLTLAAVLLGASAQAQTATNKPATSQKPGTGTEKKHKYIPFRGEIAAIDKSARTITVGKRTIQITSDTKFYKGENKTPATFDEAVTGEAVTGSYAKAGEKLLAHSVYYKGQAAATATTAEKKKKTS